MAGSEVKVTQRRRPPQQRCLTIKREQSPRQQHSDGEREKQCWREWRCSIEGLYTYRQLSCSCSSSARSRCSRMSLHTRHMAASLFFRSEVALSLSCNFLLLDHVWMASSEGPKRTRWKGPLSLIPNAHAIPKFTHFLSIARRYKHVAFMRGRLEWVGKDIKVSRHPGFGSLSSKEDQVVESSSPVSCNNRSFAINAGLSSCSVLSSICRSMASTGPANGALSSR